MIAKPLILLTPYELRRVIALEREQGRAFGRLAERARVLLAQKTGQPS